MKKLLTTLFIILVMMFGYLGSTPVEAEVQETKELSIDSYYDYAKLNELGSFTNVVIFIKFLDEADYVSPYNLSYYESIYNSMTTYSLRDYYLEVSYNQLDIQTVFAVEDTQIIYYVDDHERGYYQPYDETDNPIGYLESEVASREHELLKNAVD